MRLFGFELSIKKALTPVHSGGWSGQWSGNNTSWFPVISESSAGAWQRGETLEAQTALAHSAVFACVSLIASDIGKLPVRFTERKAGYWAPLEHSYDRLIKKPNTYQNRIQFFSEWISSKLLYGNGYVLKTRDNKGSISALRVLDPKTVTPLVSDEGEVFYRLKSSALASIAVDVTVPAREIIHDRGLTPFHPLVGVSPLTAAGLAAEQAISIQTGSHKFFQNGSRPGGILTAPGTITPDTADRLKTHWQDNFTGDKAGKVAVLGDGLRYEALAVSAIDSQLIEQLNYTAQDVCRAFHVPAWKIGAGPAAPYTGNESMNLAYYSDCLQALIESLELGLDEGLNLPQNQRTELDLDHLLRMDTVTRYAAYSSAIGGGWMAPNEARRKESLPPVAGGDTCYLQQQYFSLAEHNARQAQAQGMPA